MIYYPARLRRLDNAASDRPSSSDRSPRKIGVSVLFASLWALTATPRAEADVEAASLLGTARGEVRSEPPPLDMLDARYRPGDNGPAQRP